MTPPISSSRTTKLFAIIRHKIFLAFSIAAEEIKRLPDLSLTYKKLTTEWLYKDTSDRKATLSSSKSSADLPYSGLRQKIYEGCGDPAPRESKRPQINILSTDHEPFSSYACLGSSSVTSPAVPTEGVPSLSSTKFGHL